MSATAGCSAAAANSTASASSTKARRHPRPSPRNSAAFRVATRLSYLDWNAGALVRPEAAAAVAAALAHGGNPSSVHRAGREAKRRLEDARQAVVDLAALEALLAGGDGRPALVSLMLANNETGAIQPVAEAARLAHARGALFHCDAIQAAGKQALDRDRLGCDLMTLSAHKLGGPPGIGALILRAGLDPAPLLRGGGQERSRRAATA